MLKTAQSCTVLSMPNPSQPLSPNVPVNGDAIRARRIELGETITSLAPKIPLSVGYLSQIERGRRPRVSPPRFHLLVAALGLTKNSDSIKAAA